MTTVPYILKKFSLKVCCVQETVSETKAECNEHMTGNVFSHVGLYTQTFFVIMTESSDSTCIKLT